MPSLFQLAKTVGGSIGSIGRQLGPASGLGVISRTPAQSGAARDLGMLPQTSADLELSEEQKRRKRLMEQQRFGGMPSAAFMSLMGDAGNQY